MRSPSVLIGGHYWNIKYYPRGNPNEGTEQLSIYIECSNSPHEERKCKGPVEVIPPSNVREGEEFIHTQSSAGNPPSMIPEVSEPTTGADPEHLSLSSAGEVDHTPLNIPMEQTPVVEAPWEIAAQVSCVIYNPGEPRVNVSQKSTHRYCNENSDWGWTRFHGPWDEIHKRQRFKRQALLRNDTLAFTAYIRTIKDDTKALWWHLPKDQLEWDSLARIGLKRLVHEMSHSSALIAALSAWLYLDPITDRICNLEIPDPNQGSKPRLRPLTDALQRLIQEARGPKDTTSPVQNMFKISLNSIAKIISWYGEDGISSKNDVVATWEIIRRIVSFEASNDSQVADAADFFPEIWALKQSDCQYDDIHTSEGFGLHDFFHNEPCSVQDTVNIGLRTDSKVAHSWQTFLSHQVSSRKGPLILQVELHRQMFSPEARRWKRLTHRVKLDESITIDLPSGEELGYTLYGMVVHSGALESNDYYTVIRPAGPGTTWVKYAGDKDPKGVTRLTTKQACKSHEGKGKHVEGVSAVAYVALYVRTDSISTIFGNHSKQKETAPSLNKPQDVQGEFQLTLQKEDQKRILVQIYQSDIFNDFPSRGIFDPWAARSSRDYNSALVFEFDLDGSQTLAAVENHIFEEFSNANKKERFRLWALDTKPQSSTRGAPRFVPSLRADHRLDQLATKFGGCRFWLQIITWKDFEEMTRSNDTVEEPATTPVADHMEVVGELSASDQLRPDEIMQEPEVHPSADEVMQVQAVFNAAEEVAQEAVQNTEGTLQQQNVRDPSQNEVLSNPVTEVQERQRVPNDSMQERQEPASAEMEVTPVSSSTGVSDDLVSPVNDVSPDEDTVMDEIQEPEIGGTEVLASPSEPSLSWISTNDITPKAHIEWVYIFLKVFDCDLQTLRGVGGFFIKQKEQIGEAIRRLLVLDDNEQFDIFHEKSLTLNAFDGVRYSNTFEEIGSTFYIDGNIFIVQRRPSDSE